jgi:hypothetical protein
MSEEKKKKSVKKSEKDGDAKKTKKHTSDTKTKRTLGVMQWPQFSAWARRMKIRGC